MFLACIHIPPSFQRWLRRNPSIFLLFLVLPTVLFLYSQFSRDPWTPLPARRHNETRETSNDVLLVTALYPNDTSRHAATQYRRSLTALLWYINTPVYIFVPPYLEDFVTSFRPHGLKLYINTTFSALRDIPPLANVEGGLNHARPYFLSAASRQLSAEGYRFAFWIDSDNFQTVHAYRDWPDPLRIENALATAGTPEESIFIPVVNSPRAEHMSWTALDAPTAVGSITTNSLFGGHTDAVDWYSRAYYAHLHRWRDTKLQAESLSESLILLYPERFASVWSEDYNAPAARIPLHRDEGALGYCGHASQYHLFYLAMEEERKKMNALWQHEWRWNFWKSRTPCRDTRAIDGLSMLKSVFGSDWKPPTATFQVPGNPWV